jgi:hypothetical protein
LKRIPNGFEPPNHFPFAPLALGAVALNQSRPVIGFLENPFSAPHDVRDLRR